MCFVVAIAVPGVIYSRRTRWNFMRIYSAFFSSLHHFAEYEKKPLDFWLALLPPHPSIANKHSRE